MIVKPIPNCIGINKRIILANLKYYINKISWPPNPKVNLWTLCVNPITTTHLQLHHQYIHTTLVQLHYAHSVKTEYASCLASGTRASPFHTSRWGLKNASHTQQNKQQKHSTDECVAFEGARSALLCTHGSLAQCPNVPTMSDIKNNNLCVIYVMHTYVM